MASVLEQLLARHRKAIQEREAETFRALLLAYQSAQREIDGQIAALVRQMVAARERGETISPAWLYRQRRLAALLDQVKTQIDRFSGAAAARVAQEQRGAVELAAQQAGEQWRLLTGRGAGELGASLPTRAVEHAVGFMGNGSPVAEWMAQNLAPVAVEKLKSELIKGVALGTPFKTRYDLLPIL